jgi:tetratricopeptide (TPR) repeat protein
MGDTYFTMKQYQDAYSQYETALGIYQTAFAGEEHPYVALALNLLGRTLQLNGEYEAALEKIEAAITIYKNAFGETSPDLAWALLDRGVSLKELKKGRKACKDFLAAYDMLKNAYGESHKYVALAATYTEECK